MDLSKVALGIEFGSTRIKAILVDENGSVLSSGSYDWENQFINNIWSYSVEDIINGLQGCFASLKTNFETSYKITLTRVGVIGISAMMHGYMVFDENDNILVPFRTWRNVNATYASDILTEKLNYHIPARWSIAHLYQAILNKEPHVKGIKFQTTLEGYVHYLLTGKKVIGIGEASGMFPIDSIKKDFDEKAIQIFDELIKENGLDLKLRNIFPKVLVAGQEAGRLTKEGALLLDPTGDLKEGILFCPPEGDAETGMVATNAIRPNTGNVSAGTSIFGMIVLDKPLKKVYPEIDLVATPLGDMVAMVHCNNCSSEINSWFNLFNEVLNTFGTNIDKSVLYSKLFEKSLMGDNDCSNIISFNYLSGESITHIENGRPLTFRKTDSKFDLANFVRSQIYSAFATLKIGCDILFKEGVNINKIAAHGGLFKTEGVAQKYLAAALNTKVSVMENAGEGGAWGMAILALYMLKKQSLFDFLEKEIFACTKEIVEEPIAKLVEGFNKYIENYIKALPAEERLSEVI